MKSKLSHAYITACVSKELRDARSLRLSAALLCAAEDGPCGVCRDCRKVFAGIHPDVIVTERETDEKGALRKELLIRQIRAIISDSVTKPGEAARKVYLIKDAGYMNAEAQNALLKMLEEPPAHAAVILCAENAGMFLDTIRSRCIEIEINAESDPFDDEIEACARQYLNLAASAEKAELLRFFAEAEKMSPVKAGEFTECVESAVADILCNRRPDPGIGRAGLEEIIRLMRKAEQYLKSNVGVKNLFGMLCVRTMNLK